jgi:3D (Asp-Asp-Asp) domain-containing protein
MRRYFAVLALLLASGCVQAPGASSYTMLLPVRAYCACAECCGPQARGVTASGKDAARPGIAAACFPRGTGLHVPGYGFARVDDTGGALRRKWNRGVWAVEVRFTDHQQALEWGCRWLAVEVGI